MSVPSLHTESTDSVIYYLFHADTIYIYTHRSIIIAVHNNAWADANNCYRYSLWSTMCSTLATCNCLAARHDAGVYHYVIPVQVSTLVNSKHKSTKHTDKQTNTETEKRIKCWNVGLAVNTGGFKVHFTVDRSSLPFQSVNLGIATGMPRALVQHMCMYTSY